MIEIQQLMVDILWTPLLHSHVTLDTLCMGIPQQFVLHLETGMNKYQHVEVKTTYIWQFVTLCFAIFTQIRTIFILACDLYLSCGYLIGFIFPWYDSEMMSAEMKIALLD